MAESKLDAPRPERASLQAEAKKTEIAVVDKPDGRKEHFEAVRFLIDQMLNVPKQSGATIDSLQKILWRLDLIEEKPEAVAAEKKRQEEIQKTANEDKAKADEKAKADAKAKAEEKAA
jgi:hypothetical protein